MITAHMCPSKTGPYECGSVEFWVFQGWAWLLFGMVLVGALFWAYAWLVSRWRDRPEARRQRALAKLDRPEPPRRVDPAGPPRTRPGSHQPW